MNKAKTKIRFISDIHIVSFGSKGIAREYKELKKMMKDKKTKVVFIPGDIVQHDK